MTISPARQLLRALSSLAGPLPDFDPAAAAPTPQGQFLAWLSDAIAAGIEEPHAMALASVDSAGRPDARMLILKDIDDDGWHFATSRLSPKGVQLSHNPAVALTFYWPALGRQVRIRGESRDLGPEAAAQDFWARSPDARANAALERQSQIIGVAATETAADAKEAPKSWGVFAVRPQSVEFWQGRTDRRHIRLRYEANDRGWTKLGLWP